LAEAFFANLRTLSSKKNMAFMLVGGENMPFIISAQGDQLNRFVFESLDYFSKESEYMDYDKLVIMPTKDCLNWSKDAVSELFYITNGHPFYTKLICSEVFSLAINDRDSEISVREITSAVNKLISNLDTNSFAHHWKDGIQKTEGEAETITLNRCRCLVAVGRAVRDGYDFTYDNVCKINSSTHITPSCIKVMLRDFVRREILKEKNGIYEFCVPFFEKWLINKGVGVLIADTMGDDLAEAQIERDDRLSVKPAEIEEMVEHWFPYRGQEITTEKVRFWISQAKTVFDERVLFKILKNLRFISEIEIRDKLRTAHELVKGTLPIVVQTKKRQFRKDILISYVDGEAKSGQYFASRYAEENSIPSKNVISSNRFSNEAYKYEDSENVTLNGVVFIDDIVATGKSISTNLTDFLNENSTFIKERSMSVVIVVLVSTSDGEKAINRTIKKYPDISIEFRVCEQLASNHYAFSDSNAIWDTDEEFDMAKTFCHRIGSYIHHKQPLGFGNQGLLVVFPDRCPNNSLPILHGESSGTHKWKPLFPRPKN